MLNLREFEIRLLKAGEVMQTIPALVDSEVSARTKASILCSQFNADGFEVLPQKTRSIGDIDGIHALAKGRHQRNGFRPEDNGAVA